MEKSSGWQGLGKWAMSAPGGGWLQETPQPMSPLPPMSPIPDPSACCGCGCFVLFGLLFVILALLILPFVIWVARDSKRRGLENRRLWIWLVLLSGPVGWLIYRLQRSA